MDVIAQVPPSSLVTDIFTSFCGIRAAHEHVSAGEEPLNSDHNSPFQAAAERSSIQTSPAAGPAEATEALQHAFAAGQPLLGLVGRLGSGYNDWVHSPEPGQPRFFISNPAEAVTKTPWYASSKAYNGQDHMPLSMRDLAHISQSPWSNTAMSWSGHARHHVVRVCTIHHLYACDCTLAVP